MPDYERLARIRQGMSALNQYAGQTAVWRQYVSASAGAAEYGLGSANCYIQRTITGIFDAVKPQETWNAGGQIMMGDVWLTTILPLSKRDEVTWAGGRYMAVQDGIMVNLFGSAAGRTLIRRA